MKTENWFFPSLWNGLLGQGGFFEDFKHINMVVGPTILVLGRNISSFYIMSLNIPPKALVKRVPRF